MFVRTFGALARWLLAAMCLTYCFDARTTRAFDAPTKIAHRFLACGNDTRIVEEDGSVSWRYPRSTRDGWVLPDGNLLLAVSRTDKDGGSAVLVTPQGKTLFEFKGTQDEVNTVQALPNGNVMLTEAGDHPRVLEVDRQGKIAVEVPIHAQTKDHHLQTRMTRKLANGNYLVPHLLDQVVREIKPDGSTAWETKTPYWAFTAIRLDNGNTLIGLTLSNALEEVNAAGEVVWSVKNDELAGHPINDACGLQRLPNGNTVITSHHAKGGETKLTEITHDKKIVWTFTDPGPSGIHHFQILTTNGKPIEGRPLR